MDDQKIEKKLREATFELSSGKVIKGEVFLRIYEAHHTGPQKLGELLNGDTFFIPVKTADGLELLNIRQIVSVEFPLEDETDEFMTLGEKYTVTITITHDREQSGDVYVNLPGDHYRFKDYLNQPEPFFPLFKSQSILYINRRHILSARD